MTFNAFTDVGTIIGSIRDLTFKGRNLQYVTYLGIPYAATPENWTRFRKLDLRAKFARPYNATSFREPCSQTGAKLSTALPSEDCLFLNVYAPVESTINPTKKFPVLIYIHGGGFTQGTSSDVSPEVLSLTGDIIVVTLNYRLGILGFLNSGDEFARGNYGLWDQQLAVRWVRYNIAAFGGDVHNITLMGNEAGAASALLHALYAGNRGLFHRVIVMSGTGTSPWALHGSNVREIARELKCFDGRSNFTFSNQPLVDCIRTKEAAEILSVQSKIRNIGPTVDGEFLIDHPLKIINHVNNDTTSDAFSFFRSLDIVTGITSEDGSSKLLDLLNNAFGPTPNWNIMHLNADEFEHVIIPAMLEPVYQNHELIINKTIDNITRNNIQTSVMIQYTNWTDPKSAKNMKDNLIRLSTDVNFVVPVVTVADAHSYTNYNTSTFVYKFSYVPSYLAGKSPWVKGAAHGSDLLPAFGYPAAMMAEAGISGDDLEKEDFVMSENMLIWISNFIKTGYVHNSFSYFSSSSFFSIIFS
ncbi:hypothetical protein DPMN_050597 [Dreissena polymorpha]|uniref:Carboxylesterase type B domain-containing protein n=1 Tax=Dreissena polymorpha TaxID=45954 RepID=A0A9D4CGF6_DREPO|nr:hypothetical protein DPMN_050597 [Dreissena polymorpha]